MTLTEVSEPTVNEPALVASVYKDGAATVIALRGEGDLFTLPVVVDVLARVIAASDGPVVVDLAQARFIDVNTLRAVSRASQFLNDHGRTLTLRSPSRMAARILELLDLSRLVETNRLAV
jgi:anti-anti-sigma factor